MCQRPSLRTPKCGLTQFSAHRAQAKPRPCPSPPGSARPDGGSCTRPTRVSGWRPAWRAPAGARAPPCHPDGTRGPERRRDPEGHGCGQATSPRGAWSCRRFTDSAPDSPSGVERSRNKPTAALATCQRGRRAGVARPRRGGRTRSSACASPCWGPRRTRHCRSCSRAHEARRPSAPSLDHTAASPASQRVLSVLFWSYLSGDIRFWEAS